MKQLISWRQYLMNLMVILYDMLVPNHFWVLSQLTLSLYDLQINNIFSFLQDKVLQPRELEELFSTALER